MISKVVYRTGYDNKLFALVREGGESVSLDENVQSFRGDTSILKGGDAPHKPSSTGKVYVDDGSGRVSQYFPSVFGLKYVEVTGEFLFTN